jgi:outer membrane protein assembly factor BamB
MYHSGWCQPALGTVNKQEQLAFGGADGVLYGFDPRIDPANVAHFNGAGRTPVLARLWSFDCNPPEYKDRDGKPIPYRAKEDGPCEVIATPVFWRGRVYVAIGQDPEHGAGKGCLWCLDPGRIDDSGRPAVVWADKTINRSVCTAAIADGLLYIGDRAGDIHCFDAENGRLIWTYPTLTQLWSSTLLADGKVYVGGFNGRLWIMSAGSQKRLLSEIDLKSRIFATPVAANGVLYVATDRMLYAVQKDAR